MEITPDYCDVALLRWQAFSPDDTARRFKRDFLARFRKLDPITQAFHDAHETVLELEEWL